MESKPYARGAYNKYDEFEQWIRLTEGCPNDCEFCRETKECGKTPIYFEIPEIVRNKVKIMDMNLIYKPRCIEILDKLGSARVNNKVVYYELICGVDYRFMTQEIANALKRNRFTNIRFAWDWSLLEQDRIERCINMLVGAGYRPQELSCFIICDWKIPYSANSKKLDLLKVWNVKVNDCWFNNTTSPNFQYNYWTHEQCKLFRKKCRKHNQLIQFRIDPELRSRGK